MAESSRRWEKALSSLRFRLIASLFVLLGLSIALSMLGIWHSERDRFMEATGAEAMRAGRTIENTLRSAMIENDWNRIQQAVDDVYEIVEPSMISIISNDGTVTVSSDSSLAGTRFDRYADPSCVVCHALESTLPARQAIFLETGAGPILRNIIKVPNGPECHGCHSPEEKNLGVLIYDARFSDTFAMLRQVFLRIAFISFLTFCFLVAVLSFIIHRFVHRPLRRLMEGFVRVGQGDFEHWVEVDARGEFQEMAEQFNVMSRAIGRLFAEIKRKNWETATLYTFVQQLSRAIEWRKLRQTIVNLLFATFRVEQVVLILPRGRREEACEVSWRQSNDRRFHHLEFAAGAEMEMLPAWVRMEIEQWRNRRGISMLEIKNRLAVLPLASKNMTVGLICLDRGEGGRYSEAEKNLLAAVGEQIGIALANARLYHLATTDDLTGLYTRRYCESMIRKWVDGREAGRPGFTALMLDLDHFKQINDTHGHQVGDQVLVQLADLVRANIRYDDIACRYGGEEFIVLTVGDLEAGWLSASRLRQVIEGYSFSAGPAPGGSALPLHLTVSIGLAEFPRHGGTLAEIIRAADQALYDAKRRGRNQVVCFEPGITPPVPGSP